MDNVKVLGVGMTKFSRHKNESLRSLAHLAVTNALADAEIEKNEIQAIFFANSMAGFITGQECIRGQVSMWDYGFQGIPVYNIENACASASTAFNLAHMSVKSGQYDVVLVVGVEKLYHEERERTLKALAAASDIELLKGLDVQGSIFIDSYAKRIKAYMDKYGLTPLQLARISEKNRFHASLNPYAQYRDLVTAEEILQSPMVADPLTRLMCSPIGDGAAAAVISSSEYAKHTQSSKTVDVLASVVTTSAPYTNDADRAVERAAKRAYEIAGVGPGDIHVAEVHDAVSPVELFMYESLGFCKAGEGVKLLEEKATTLGGRIPVNTSGGLVSKGNPSGATGAAQICEVVWQLRGEAGERQVDGAKIGLTENAGGRVGSDSAAVAVHIFCKII
jgi:acetyl-CoA acetyltransferase